MNFAVQHFHFLSESFQAALLFVFHSNVETDLDKGDSRVYFLHLEDRETQDWFYPLPGNGKASRRPHCQGKGQRVILCDKVRETVTEGEGEKGSTD